MNSKPWGIILAGGDGKRLKTVSRFLSGDNRPKQFCALFGGSSLLTQTRGRLRPAIESDRMLFTVVKDHARFYGPELADVAESNIVVQPANRGTTAAIVYSLIRVTRVEKDPMVAFFPADHHYLDEKKFARSVNSAFEVVKENCERLVLLGTKAEAASVEYGWIEPGRRLSNGGTDDLQAYRVNRFWEKPSAPIARRLLDRGCLWNTFVIAGKARAFLELLETMDPAILKAFQPVAEANSKKEEAERASELYQALPTGDFSHDVLSQCAERLAVLQMDDAGWGDIGTPEGVLAALERSAPSAEGRDADESKERVAARDAFETWWSTYCQGLQEVCRHASGKNSSDKTFH